MLLFTICKTLNLCQLERVTGFLKKDRFRLIKIFQDQGRDWEDVVLGLTPLLFFLERTEIRLQFIPFLCNNFRRKVFTLKRKPDLPIFPCWDCSFWHSTVIFLGLHHHIHTELLTHAHLTEGAHGSVPVLPE